MYSVVQDEPPWIDWKMPHIISGVNMVMGGRGLFSDPRPPHHTCTPPSKCKSKQKDFIFQRRQFKKSEYIVHLFEFLRSATGTEASSRKS